MIFTCGQVQDLNRTSPLSLKKYQKHLFYQLEVSPYNFPLCIAKSTTPISVQLCSFFLYRLSSPRRVCKPARGQWSSACSKADSCECDIIDWNGGYSDDYRNGDLGMSVMYWAPDYEDATIQLAFMPGDKMGLRVGWEEDMAQDLADKSLELQTEFDEDRRLELFTELQEELETYGPYIPLFQSPSHFGHRSDLSGVEFNSSYLLEVRNIK